MAGKPTAKQFTVHFEGERTVYAQDAEHAADTVSDALRRVGFEVDCETDTIGEPIDQSTEG